MSVPVAAVNLDDRVPLRQHDIGRARELRNVLAKPKTKAVKGTTNADFRPGILAANARHHPRTGRLVDDVDDDFSPGYGRRTWYCQIRGRSSAG